ncbi:MAG: hypothetical protein NVSMB12_00910 [Acidimicrobiales bacterium]
MTTVLIVEDEDDLRLLTRMMLERAGFNILEAASGAAAISILDEQPIDVVVLDLRIPPPDGWGVLDHIAATGLLARLDVVVVSAFSDPAIAARAEAMGCQRYLAKPFKADELIAAVGGGDRTTS